MHRNDEMLADPARCVPRQPLPALTLEGTGGILQPGEVNEAHSRGDAGPSGFHATVVGPT
jgi:hypothetical protein